jgi:hypothetical protein
MDDEQRARIQALLDGQEQRRKAEAARAAAEAKAIADAPDELAARRALRPGGSS